MLQPMPRLPGAARRTASIGVQTIGNFLQVEIEPIKLPESREQCASQEGNNAPAIMASLSSEDEVSRPNYVMGGVLQYVCHNYAEGVETCHILGAVGIYRI